VSDRAPVEWGVAARRRRGERASGDAAVVAPVDGGVLVAGIDGLGHGAEAARAARAAADALRGAPAGDLVTLLERCDAALRGTRGAAISVAFVSGDGGELRWVGVGSVEGRVVSGDPTARGPKGSLLLGRGVAGHELPALQVASLALEPGDVVLLATDGIDAAFADGIDTAGSPQAISERILAAHRKPPDDALVLAVRYVGAGR